MKTGLKIGQINVKVHEEAEVLIDGIETTFEGTPAEVVEVLKTQSEIIKVMIASMNSHSHSTTGFGGAL